MKKSNILKALLIAIVLTVVGLSVLFAATVEVVIEEGVPETAKQETLLAVEKTARFFAGELKLELDQDVKIILVPNKAAYSRVMIREYNISSVEAERRARTTRAWSSKNVIIQNRGAATLATHDERLFNIAHELVHQYQRQLSAGKSTRIEWMTEGTADAIAARILERDGRRTLQQYRNQRLDVIGKAKTHPKLGTLRTPQQWYDSLDLYGSTIPYRVADIAVLTLLESNDYTALFQYFSLSKDLNGNSAFHQRFGISLEDYEKALDAKLDYEINLKKEKM